MYKSPIEKIYSEIQTQMAQEDENMIMTAIRKVGVNVDKAELIKALRYDRNQYTKGYEDGKNDVLNVVLDKIRGEIERKAHSGQWSDAVMYGMIKAGDIIDKYKAESEG